MTIPHLFLFLSRVIYSFIYLFMFGYLNLDLKMSYSFPKAIIWLALTCGDILTASWCTGTLKIS